jgi:hypothetical protein
MTKTKEGTKEMIPFVISGYTKETFEVVVYADDIEKAQELALECMSNDDYSSASVGSREEIDRDFGVTDAACFSLTHDTSGNEITNEH